MSGHFGLLTPRPPEVGGGPGCYDRFTISQTSQSGATFSTTPVLVVVVVIVIVIELIPAPRMPPHLSASLSDPCQHRPDPNPYRLPLPVFSSSPHPESIRSPTLSCERFGNSGAERPGLPCRRLRRCSGGSLVRREAAPRVMINASQPLGRLLQPSHRPDRNPVDIELVTAKRRRFFDYDNDNDNDNDKDRDKDCVRCSTCF